MSTLPDVTFVPLETAPESVVAILVGADLAWGTVGRRIDGASGGALTRAAGAAGFKGKARSTIEILSPAGIDSARVLLVGYGDADAARDQDWTNLGGVALGQMVARKCRSASLVVDVAGSRDADAPATAARLGLGVLLRSYAFDKYRTRKPADEGTAGAAPAATLDRVVIHTADPRAATAAFAARRALAEGVWLARDLVNEPANMLGPVEFAERVRELTSVGVEVEVLDADALAALKMNALLGVAQGSARPARVAVMQWHGAKAKRSKPVCFVGKGVCFDTGGISMKPAAGMEDMKGDMGGAACVTGLMHVLAARKANVNAIGIVGLVENMPSATAQRPGDIVSSMSGQTIEVLNTDAEGRLVLADVLWYAQDRFKPRFIIDLATLTGAIMVALGREYAGLFANDDKLADELKAAAEATGEKVWRMPLDRAYDKLIDSKNADMKNIGGRYGGAITAAQFIKRFIKDTPWAHLDIAGTAMDSTRNDVNQSWGSGWGVRLLDRLVADNYEGGRSQS